MIGTSKRDDKRGRAGWATRWPVWTFLALLALFGVDGSTAAADFGPDAGAPVAPHLAAQLAATPDGETVSFLVVLNEQVDAVDFVDGAEMSAASRSEKSAALYTALTATARTSQAPLRAWLDQHKIAYRPFYIVNMIEVRATPAQADQIRRLPHIDRLAPNPSIPQNLPAIEPISQSPNLPISQTPPQNSTALTYGLSAIGADKVWALGIRGQGVVVASQDTGVEWTHPAIQARYRGWDAGTSTASHAYNWYDAFPNDPNRPTWCDPNPQIPCDDHGHGTHTVGTLTGTAADGAAFANIGVAPDAEWIGCRNMDNGIGTPASYTACFEFFLAPYPQGGDPATQGRPDLAPHIINNSWSCPSYEGCDVDSLRQIVETLRAAGQLVVSSAGNEGASCGSVQNPIAIYDAAFTVGAVGQSGTIAGFSSRGPVDRDGSGRAKPDLSAPGVAVYSSYVGDSYGYLSGTSMASPHVAGAAALLWSAVPDLLGKIDLTEQILLKSAEPVLNDQCDPVAVSPNNVYGYGRLDIYAAVLMATHPATVTITYAGTDGQPIPDTAMILTDQRTGYTRTVTTGPDGQATLFPMLAGEYTVALAHPTLWEATVVAPFTIQGGESTDVTLNRPFSILIMPIYRVMSIE